MKQVSLTGVIAKTADSSIQLGQIRTTTKGGFFMRVRLATTESVLPVAGSPLGWVTGSTSADPKVTTDISRSLSTQVMGVACAAATTSQPYFWACIAGDFYGITGQTLKTDTNITAAGMLAWKGDKVGYLRTVGQASTLGFNCYARAVLADSGSQLLHAHVCIAGGAANA